MSSPKSTHIEEKLAFLDLISATPKPIRDLYSELKINILRKCGATDYGYTNKPDFRIANGFVMIELVPKKDEVLVMLRVDGDGGTISSAGVLSGFANPANQAGKPGDWIEFTVNSASPLQQVEQVICGAYQYRTQHPW